MANTTNFGWETPDDTDLVKDGAAAIRTLAGAIDTSLVDLKGGTTGQVLAKNSNTDMDFVWSADASGIPATIFDAKGDLIVASAADTAARLAVGGTNGHVLTVDSNATNGITWAAPAGGGKVLQVVNATTTTSVTISTATFTDTNLTASITPTSATSKILVICNQVPYLNRAGVNIFASGRIMRGATSIYELGYIGGFGVPNATGTIEFFAPWTPVYLDSPSTTSSTTYKTQMCRNAASGDVIPQFGSNPSTITLLEIGA